MNLIKKNTLVFLFLLFTSVFLFRGRLGSDDLEVFNFIDAFFKSGLSLNDFLLSFDKHHFYDENQVPIDRTIFHRTFWLIQTYFVYFFFNPVFKIFTSDPSFYLQYISGFLISFYSCLSFFLFYKYLCIKNLNFYESFFLTASIFFGTGLIAFFTGAYIESAIILLLLLKYFLKKSFVIDLLIVFIKPYYFVLVFFNKYINVEKNNLLEKTKYIMLLILIYLGFRLLFFFNVTPSIYLNSFSNFTLDPIKIIDNFSNLLFSFGYGIFFTAIIPILLIFFGFKKKETSIKLLGVLTLILFFSFFTGSHGQSPGGRYLIPSIIIFLDEILLGYILLKKKCRLLIVLLSFLTIINFPVLEFRNFSLPIYTQGSSSTGKINAFNRLDDYDWFRVHVNNHDFHPSIFSIKIFLSKVLNKQEVYISKLKIKTRDIYPMTSFARLIYINNNQKNIWIAENKVLTFLLKFNLIYKYLYFFLILMFLFFYLFSLINILKKNEH